MRSFVFITVIPLQRRANHSQISKLTYPTRWYTMVSSQVVEKGGTGWIPSQSCLPICPLLAYFRYATPCGSSPVATSALTLRSAAATTTSLLSSRLVT